MASPWRPSLAAPRRARHAAGRGRFRAYATYGILIVTVLIGQIGNFAGISKLKPPANVTALLKCGQGGNRLCPDPWVGPSAAVSPQGFRFPVWEFNWPGAYRIQDGKPCGSRAARSASRGGVERVSADLPARLSRRGRHAGVRGGAARRSIPMLLVRDAAGRLATTFVKTVRQLRLPMITIAFILSIATVMNYSGMTSSMALALAKTGRPLSVLLRLARHDRRVPDRQRHVVEHPVRAPAGDDREAVGSRSDPDGGDQQLRRRDGEDDQPAESVRRRRRRRRGRSRRGDSREGLLHSLILTGLMGVVAMLQAYVVPWMVPRL